MLSIKELARYIDHTQLKPEATYEDVEKLCSEAKKYGFCSVFVNSCYAKYAVEKLMGSEVNVGVAVGFPLGAASSEAKAFEAEQAIKAGAREVDMVINIGLLKSGDYFAVREDIEAVVKAAKRINPEAKVKVILEMCYLNPGEKVSACELARDAGADFVKTSTGFGPGGATVEDVELMKKLVGETMGVKAAGGIRDLRTAMAMIEAGATRIGTSSGVAILSELNRSKNA
ncbi:MAG: deoxyribose-phosphate aldolase [Tepidanaerobacteraceae bacterium]|jgi:deoxyribose-phosphate aldolase|nr:deoxyribose-phosphate aldolase [Tepidanaerobacteraceae bacterium]